MADNPPVIDLGAFTGDIPVVVVAAVISLLLIATLAALITRRLGFPYTIGLVFVGLGIGWLAESTNSTWLGALRAMHLTPNVIL